MESISEMIKILEQRKRVGWQGGITGEVLSHLEKLLQVRLPNSFRLFLLDYGGGGVIGQEISGVEDCNAIIDTRGTVYGDTLMCRDELELPVHLVVIYLGDDYVVLCLDTSAYVGDECSVVSFNVTTKSVHYLFPTFSSFLNDYLVRRIA